MTSTGPPPTARRTIGVDVGGTKLAAVVLEITDGAPPSVIQARQRPVPVGRPGSAEGVPEVIAALAQELAGGHRAIGAVGVGLAGFLGPDGVAVHAPNVPQIVGVDMASAVGERTGLPVVVDNDANCVARAALALHRPPVSDLVAVTLGTGIGGGIVSGGRLVRGAHGFAGEPGHMVVDPGGEPCVCGQRGCWERYASGSGLAMLASRAVDAGRADSLRTEHGGAPGGERVVAAAAAGDPAAGAILEEFADWVALGMANLVNLLDPELVVIGGGLADAAEAVLPQVRARMADNPTMAGRRVRIEPVSGGSRAGAVGAALLADAHRGMVSGGV